MGFGVGSATNRGFNGFQAYSGGHQYFQLTNAAGTTAQQVKVGAGRLARIYLPQGGTAAITIFDAASADATTLSTAVVLYSGTLPADPVDLQIPTENGLCVQARSPVDNTVLIGFL